MEFTIKRWPFFQALKAALIIINKKATLPIIESVAVVTKEDKHFLVATDLEVTYFQQLDLIPGSKKSKLDTVFDPGPVIKFLESVPRDIDEIRLTITVEGGHPNRMLLQAGFDEFGIPLLQADEFPKVPDLENPESISIDRLQFRSGLKNAMSFTGKDELRPVMTGVYLDLTTEYGPYVVATDAHKLFRQRVGKVTVSNPEANLSIVIPRKAIIAMDKILDTDVANEITLYVSTTQMMISDFEGRRVLYARLIDGKYPQWKAVIPIERERVCTFHAEDLKGRLSMASVTSSINNCMLGIRKDKIHLQAINLDFNQLYKAEIDARSTAEVNIGVNAFFMSECIETLDSGIVYAYFSAPNRAVVITRPAEKDPEEDILILIMPVMVDTPPKEWENIDTDMIYNDVELFVETTKKHEPKERKETKKEK